MTLSAPSILRMLLFVASTLGVGAAALRLASHWTRDGSLRLIAAAPIAGTIVITQSMGLGLAKVGTNPAALAATSVITWLVVRLIVSTPEITPTAAEQFGAWWSSLGVLPRAGMGALVGATVTFLVYFLARPLLVGDTVSYHLPLASAWVHDGQPGSLHHVYRTLAVENYPLVDEVLLSWQLGLSGSLVPLSIWPLPLVVLSGVAAVTGLVRIGASRIVAIAGATALLTTPLLLVGLSSHSTDASTLAWLLIAGALVACSREQAVLLAPAVLAAALSIGTRTQSAPVVAAIAIWALVLHRPWHALRPYRKQITAAALLAILVAGFWYLRNILLHGSPLWPTVGTPWGAPRSSYFNNAPRFLDQPLTYLTHALNHRVKAGGIPLLLAGIAAPLFTRRMAVRICAIVAALGTALWMFTPFSGETDFATTRYLFPLMAASMAALVLAANEEAWRRTLITLFLLASIAWNMFHLNGPIDGFVRSTTLLAGAALGALLTLVVGPRWTVKVLSLPVGLRAGIVAVCISGLLVAFVPGYFERHLEIEAGRMRTNSIVPVARWLSGQDRFVSDGDPIAMTWGLYGPLTGDRLQHPLKLVRDSAPCATFDQHAAAGWLLIRRSERGRDVPGYQHARDCLRDRSPVYSDTEYVVFSDKAPEAL
jgi:hypothetical protein